MRQFPGACGYERGDLAVRQLAGNNRVKLGGGERLSVTLGFK